MRKFLASLGVACLATAASAQDIDVGALPIFNTGASVVGTSWKIVNPSAAGDWMNSDLGGLVTGVTSCAAACGLLDTQGTGGTMGNIGFYPDLGGGVPDISSGNESVGVTVNAGVTTGNYLGFDITDVALGSTGHVALHFQTGDSNLWLTGDTSVSGRSYFTAGAYATGAIPFTLEWWLGIAGMPPGSNGTLLVNGAASATVDQSDEVCLLFTACQNGVGSALYVFSPVVIGPLLPLSITITGNAITGGPCDGQWNLCYQAACGLPVTSPVAIGLGTFYLDPCDTKPNGKPKSKVSSTASLTIVADPFCTGGCFGWADDGVLDATIWKVQNPAGASDWFNVDVGVAPGSVSTITGIEIASWDFCGAAQTWAEVGVYPDQGANPGTPDITAGLTTLAGGGLAASAADWTYPATFYDTPNAAPGGGVNYHSAANWNTGDSCVWMGSDTDALDGGCATGFGQSGFTINDYTTAEVPFSAANWMMKIDWT